jgi:acetyltransferase-like isoleucine patch superfamily enzyme
MSIVSKNIRVRHPEYFSIGEHSIVDDFCYFSTKVKIGRYAHIASGCSVAGGIARLFTLGNYSSLSSGVKIWCASDDFVNDIVAIIPPEADEGGSVKDHLISGDVTMGDFTAVGSNTVVMPLNEIPEGTTIGALSFVPARFRFEPWTVYAGVPIRRVASRNRENVLRQVQMIERRIREGRA